jgi:hypothetical protein
MTPFTDPIHRDRATFPFEIASGHASQGCAGSSVASAPVLIIGFQARPSVGHSAVGNHLIGGLGNKT